MHATEQNGVMIVRTPTGIGVHATRCDVSDQPLRVEVDYEGRRIKDEEIPPLVPWRDYYAGVDMMRCAVRVKQGGRVLAQINVIADTPLLPFMIPLQEQRHVTDNYVSVPPALTITYERGDVWTLGFAQAPWGLCPDGEFAFDVLRNGRNVHEIASRIERRDGKVRVFTRHGWKIWNGCFFL